MTTYNLTPQRLHDESFEAYKERRKENNDAIRRYLSGRYIYLSQENPPYRRNLRTIKP